MFQNNSASSQTTEGESIADLARGILSFAPIAEDDRELLEILLDPPWFLEVLVAWAILHCGDAILAGERFVAARRIVKWAIRCGLFHDELNRHMRGIFLGVVILVAEKLLIAQKRHSAN